MKEKRDETMEIGIFTCLEDSEGNTNTNSGNSSQAEITTTQSVHPFPNTNIPSSTNTVTTTESLQGKFTCLIDSEGRKRFLCTVAGCEKKYKNINGIKYTCHCGKAYKSRSGLRYHQATIHILQ